MLAARAAKGLPTPSWDNRPVIFEDLVPVWNAFWALSDARDVGWGANPIRASDVLAHLSLSNVSKDERGEWYALIRYLDALYLAEQQRRREKRDKTKGAKRGDAQNRNRRP
jgi:hypothetical protein